MEHFSLEIKLESWRNELVTSHCSAVGQYVNVLNSGRLILVAMRVQKVEYVWKSFYPDFFKFKWPLSSLQIICTFIYFPTWKFINCNKSCATAKYCGIWFLFRRARRLQINIRPKNTMELNAKTLIEKEMGNFCHRNKNVFAKERCTVLHRFTSSCIIMYHPASLYIMRDYQLL